MSAVVGMTDAHLVGMTPAQRKVYKLLTDTHPQGLSRDALKLRAGLGDRACRDTVEELRPIAALTSHPKLGSVVLGFDPLAGVYTYAKDRDQCDRILAYQHKRVESLLQGLLPQVDAARSMFGPSSVDASIQDRLFDAKPLLRAFR